MPSVGTAKKHILWDGPRGSKRKKEWTARNFPRGGLRICSEIEGQEMKAGHFILVVGLGLRTKGGKQSGGEEKSCSNTMPLR